ncbi:unnamed protein product [Xylocopa violacea]|uniref:Uncharacterized protein n=1 Tax=Xylocopa violacea TaxID=135666 RepID=A0ABP1NAS3_XYLVO
MKRDTKFAGSKFGLFARIGSVLLLVALCSSSGQTLALTFDNSTSAFVERCRVDCSLYRDFASCGKYRIVRWLHNAVREKEFSYGPIRIVRIQSLSRQSVLPKLPQSRVFKSGAIEALNFVRDAVEDLLTKRALVYTIDNSASARSFGSMPMIMDEDELVQIQKKQEPEDGDWRIFKKKKSLILPILILLNLLKLKLLLLPIFLSVHFIKKLLVLASIIVPSLLAHLKICKVPPAQSQTHPYHMWATAADTPVDYPTGYGQDEAWAHRNDYQGNPPYFGFPYGLRNPYG